MSLPRQTPTQVVRTRQNRVRIRLHQQLKPEMAAWTAELDRLREKQRHIAEIVSEALNIL